MHHYRWTPLHSIQIKMPKLIDVQSGSEHFQSKLTGKRKNRPGSPQSAQLQLALEAFWISFHSCSGVFVTATFARCNKDNGQRTTSRVHQVIS